MRIRSVRFPGALILAATFALSALPDPASAQQPGCRFLLDNCGPQNPPEGIPAPQQTPVPPPPAQTPAPIPPPAPGSGNCGHPHGDYVVVRVKWGDAIGGLAVRSAPDSNAERLEVIPATGSGIGVSNCRAGWCQVKHACASGWASAAFLSPRTSEIYRVTGVSANDPQGLNVRTGPAYTYATRGPGIPYNGTDVIVHTCQPSPNDQTNWCLVTYRGNAGWVAGRFLTR